MTLRQLTYFVAMVQFGSISRAAKEIGVSQPTMTEQLQRLESPVHGLGLALFERHFTRPGGVTLTPAGHALLPHAKAIIAAADRARLDVARTALPAPC